MSLFRKVFGEKASVESRQPSFEDSTDDHDDEIVARQVKRRDMVRMVFVDAIRRHGIPSDWIECHTLSLAQQDRRMGLYVTLVVRDGQDRLLSYVPAFQTSLREALERNDPRLTDWMHGIVWQFGERKGAAQAATATAPAPASPAVPQTSNPSAPEMSLQAAAPKAPAPQPTPSPAVNPQLPPVDLMFGLVPKTEAGEPAAVPVPPAAAVPAAPAPAQEPDDLEDDLRALFAIRDAALSEPASLAEQSPPPPTRPEPGR
jgi:hypothetical protein